MSEAKGSLTAQAAAACRVVESQKPEAERMIYDPYAVHFMTEEGWEFFGSLLKSHPGAQLLHVLRTKAAEDHLISMVSEGARQVVIVGAGYDCSALRIEELKEGAKVFEIDEPYTSQLKQEKIREICGCLPDHVAYIVVDLIKESLADLRRRMVDNGYNIKEKTVFVLGSLIMYLTPEAADNLFRFMAESSCQDSSIVFTNIDLKGQKKMVEEEEISTTISDETARSGEPHHFGLGPEEMESYLTLRGYTDVSFACMRHIKERRGDKTYPFDYHYYIVTAKVGN
jgi:methyltransferase (TIGR00027 family)